MHRIGGRGGYGYQKGGGSYGYLKGGYSQRFPVVIQKSHKMELVKLHCKFTAVEEERKKQVRITPS